MMKKTQKELNNKLQTSITLIKHHLSDIERLSLDDGLRFEIGTEIATKMRVLLHDNHNSSRSLLGQLNIKDEILFPLDYSQSSESPSNLVSSYKLVGLKISSKGMYCESQIPDFKQCIFYHFDNWWNEVIIDPKKGCSMMATRKDVVLTLADKEGGAHEDEKHTEEYQTINYESGFMFVDAQGYEQKIKNNYYIESVIAIANELVYAFDLYFKVIDNSMLHHEKTEDNIIRIVYKKKNYYCYRFCPNGKRNLFISMLAAFDHYNDATYQLFHLEMNVYENSKKRIGRSLLVIDNSSYEQIEYLKNDELGIRLLLIQKEQGYIRVQYDSDIMNNTDYHDLEYYKKRLENGEYETLLSYIERMRPTT